MVDRIGSDHPTITSARATVARHGPHRCIELPAVAAEGIPRDRKTVRAVVEGRERVARLGRGATAVTVVGLFDTRHAAERGPIEFDRLADWLDAIDRDVGSSVLVDVLEAGERLGLRAPGERVTYRIEHRPTGGLADIAERYVD